MFRKPQAEAENIDDNWLRIRINGWVALGCYFCFMFLIYWPVFLEKRFFWEDFFKEYPIREFSFYMAGLKHTLPFWNPYSWGWAPLMADAQSGFWYPTNLLQIAIARIVIPSAIHLPVLLPESMTLLHLPIAALGVFYLLKKEFGISDIVALIAGITWGFGTRMVAEQNHSMQIIQLSLLPWETLLLMRSWRGNGKPRSWRSAIWLGLLFGISFFAGQPQTFLFIGLFLSAFTLFEVWRRYKEHNLSPAPLLGKERGSQIFRPLLHLALAMIIASGIAAIQLLPSLELTGYSARQHLSYGVAAEASLHLGHIIDFFIPKFYGEYPGYTIPKSPTVNDHYWYWEATFYWGVLAEILAVYGILRAWKKRKSDGSVSRYAPFIIGFSVFALAYGLGGNLYFQWLFWKFVPLFDHIRAPNRMVWFLWFLGSLATGFGLQELVRRANNRGENKRFFLWSCWLFLALNILVMGGAFDYIVKGTYREGLWLLTLPSFIAACATGAFFYAYVTKKLPVRFILPFAILLIAADLYYADVTWHRNTLDPETVVAQDSTASVIQQFRQLHEQDHAKLLVLDKEAVRKMKPGLGMFLRLPIEVVQDSAAWTELNPMRLTSSLPLVADSTRRMEIMGVAERLNENDSVAKLPNHLPFLKLYHNWSVVKTDSEAARVYNNSDFDFQKTIVLNASPSISSATASVPDTAVLDRFSENELQITVKSSRSAILLVNDLYYPAWKATVDGRDTKILRGFTSLRAIPVLAGLHHIELQYDDTAFDLGWKITMATLALSLLVLGLGPKQKSLDQE